MRPVLALFLLLPACAVPPHASDPTIPSTQVRTPHFAAPEFRLHVLSVNGAQIPEQALERSVATISRQLGRPVRVVHHSPMVYTPEELGPRGEPGAFPIIENGRTISEAELVPLYGQPYLLAEPRDGILGVVGVPQPDGMLIPKPYIEEATALVIVVPGTANNLTGFTTSAAIAPSGERQPSIVYLRDAAIRGRSGFFVSYHKLYEWTLTHELGHVLRVPASNSQIWNVPGLGPHCTHPECVMYTGLDWRVVVSGVLHGWPLDFCSECAMELSAARAAAATPP